MPNNPPPLMDATEEGPVVARFSRTEWQWTAIAEWLRRNPEKVAALVTPTETFEVRLTRRRSN